MTLTRRLVAFSILALLVACDSASTDAPVSSDPGSGGQPGAGETATTGGTVGTGGAVATGGQVSASGGAGAGGAIGTGGLTGSGGVRGTGGTVGTGGLAGTGGVRGTGGAVGTGGLTGTGGVRGTGGAVGTGGLPGTGGVRGTGGLPGTGGVRGTGGAMGTGGSTSVGDISITDPVPGFASVNGSTTGGGTAIGSATTVSSMSALQDAAKGSNAAIILVEPGSYSGSLTLGANKTIIGKGPGVTINGNIKISGSGASNVIIRNLAVRGPHCNSYDECKSGSDAVYIGNDANHVWLDHLDVADGQDGNCDITHGGDYITVSWTYFHYTYAKEHRYSNLIAGSDDVHGLPLGRAGRPASAAGSLRQHPHAQQLPQHRWLADPRRRQRHGAHRRELLLPGEPIDLDGHGQSAGVEGNRQRRNRQRHERLAGQCVQHPLQLHADARIQGRGRRHRLDRRRRQHLQAGQLTGLQATLRA
jgi:hypothetical protein